MVMLTHIHLFEKNLKLITEKIKSLSLVKDDKKILTKSYKFYLGKIKINF